MATMNKKLSEIPKNVLKEWKVKVQCWCEKKRVVMKYSDATVACCRGQERSRFVSSITFAHACVFPLVCQAHGDSIEVIKGHQTDFCWILKFSFFLSFFCVYLPSPDLGLTPPGTYNPNVRGSDACRESNCLWTRALDRYTRASLSECVVSTMSGPPPKTAQDAFILKLSY